MIAEHLAELRHFSESMMRDTATIERKSGSTLDPDNGQQVDQWALVVTTPARLLRTYVGGRRSQAAGQTVDRGEVEFRFPVTVTDLRVGDRVTFTASADLAIVGVPIPVVEVEYATDAVARRAKGVVDEDRHV